MNIDTIKSYMFCVLTSYLIGFCVHLFLVWFLMDKLFEVWANNNEQPNNTNKLTYQKFTIPVYSMCHIEHSGVFILFFSLTIQ